MSTWVLFHFSPTGPSSKTYVSGAIVRASINHTLFPGPQNIDCLLVTRLPYPGD